jgi:hypothetical protein
VQLERARAAEGASRIRLSGCVKKTGGYILSVAVRGTPLPSWPRRLEVRGGRLTREELAG